MEEAGEQELRGRTVEVCGREETKGKVGVVLSEQAGAASQAVDAGGHQRRQAAVEAAAEGRLA